MKISGELLAVLSAVSIGFAIPLGAQSSKVIGAFQMTAYSSLLSVVFLLPLSVVAKERLEIKNYLKLYPKEAASIIIASIIFGNLLYFYGASLTEAIHSGFMLRLEPIFVVAWGAVFLKDRPTKKQLALILLMILGAFLLSTGGMFNLSDRIIIGDLTIVTSLLFFSYVYIPIKRIGNKINPTTILIANNLIGGSVLFAIGLLLPISMTTVNASNAWMLLGYVLFFSVIALYLYYAAMRRTRPWVVSSLLSSASVVGGVASYLWLRDVLNLIQIIGAVAILASSYFIARSLR